MKKKCNKLLGLLCYALGILAALYVGGYLMLIKPIHVIIMAFGNDMLTLPLLLKSIIKIAFSTTFAGLVWCIGYITFVREMRTLTGRLEKRASEISTVIQQTKIY